MEEDLELKKKKYYSNLIDEIFYKRGKHMAAIYLAKALIFNPNLDIRSWAIEKDEPEILNEIQDSAPDFIKDNFKEFSIKTFIDENSIDIIQSIVDSEYGSLEEALEYAKNTNNGPISRDSIIECLEEKIKQKKRHSQE